MGAPSETPRRPRGHRRPPQSTEPGPVPRCPCTATRQPHHDAATPEFPRHVVTAVLVSHDGARWLPDALAGLLGQERPVQNVVAADTGSADDSARLLTDALGADRVLHLARRTGFGQAVEEAARTAPRPHPRRPAVPEAPQRLGPRHAAPGATTRTTCPSCPHGEPVQWLWLLHDDCAPEPDALAELLRVVENEHELGRTTSPSSAPSSAAGTTAGSSSRSASPSPTAAAAGPAWTAANRTRASTTRSAPCCPCPPPACSIRRDVFEQLGGFDRRLPLMRDDVDLCWRAHAAGHRVLVAPDAVVRHAEAASRERRTVDCVGRTAASPHRSTRPAPSTPCSSTAARPLLPWVLLRLVLGTLLRTARLPRRQGPRTGRRRDPRPPGHPAAARADHRRAPQARQRRRSTRASCAPLFPPPGATVRATVEQVAGNLGGGSDAETSGGWPARRRRRVRTRRRRRRLPGDRAVRPAQAHRPQARPGALRSCCCSSPSSPAATCSAAARSRAAPCCPPPPTPPSCGRATWTAGTRSAPAAPSPRRPTSRVLAAARHRCCSAPPASRVTVLLVCSVPLAGFTAYFASRPLVESRLLRAWAAVATPSCPPPPARSRAAASAPPSSPSCCRSSPARASPRSGLRAAPAARGSWRATWAYALLLTLTTAFTPDRVAHRAASSASRVLVRAPRATSPPTGCASWPQLGTPLLVLAPWSLTLLPVRLLPGGRPGVRRRLGLRARPARHQPRRPRHASAGCCSSASCWPRWPPCCARERQFGDPDRLGRRPGRRSLFAVLSNGSDLGRTRHPRLRHRPARRRRARRRRRHARASPSRASAGASRSPRSSPSPPAAGPLLAAAGWMIGGADGPLERRDPVQVPAFVAEESGTRDQARTLVLDGDSAAQRRLHPGPRLRRPPRRRRTRRGRTATNAALDKVVANLVAGSGADQADQLGGFAVRYVLVRDGRAPRDQPRPGRHARPEPAQPAGRQRPVAGRPRRSPARPSSPPPARATRDRRSPPAPSRSTPRSRPAPTAASCASPTPPTRAGRPPSTASRSPAPPSTAGPRASNSPPTAAGWTSPTTTPSPTPPGSGRRAPSPSSCSSSPCPAAAASRRRPARGGARVPAQAVAGEGRRARRLRAQAEAEAERDRRDDGQDPAQDASAPRAARPRAPRWDRTAPLAQPRHRRAGLQRAVGTERAAVRGRRVPATYGGEQYQGAVAVPASRLRAAAAAVPGGPVRRPGSTTRTRTTAAADGAVRAEQRTTPGYEQPYDPQQYDPYAGAAAPRTATGNERPDGSQQ